MIKLKDILAESTKVELHKVITDKTEPAFMTEEQWDKKWSNKQPLTEGRINDLLKRAVYKFISGTFNFNPPRDNKSIAIVQKYLYTGKISKAESKQVYKLFNKQLYVSGGAVGVFLAAIIGLVPAAAIAIITATIIKKYGAKWLTPSSSNNFLSTSQAEEYQKMDGKSWVKKVEPLAGKAVLSIEAKILKLVDRKGYEWFMGLDSSVKKAGKDLQTKIK